MNQQLRNITLLLKDFAMRSETLHESTSERRATMPVKSPVRPTASTSSNPAVAHTELVTDTRRIVSVEPERVVHVSSTDFPGHYPGEDHSWNLEKFKQVE